MVGVGQFEHLVINSPHLRSCILVGGSVLANELRFGDQPDIIMRQGARALIAVTVGQIDPFLVRVLGMVLETDVDNPGLLTAEVHEFSDGRPRDQRCTIDTCGAGMFESLGQSFEEDFERMNPDAIFVTPYLAIRGGRVLYGIINEAYEGATGTGSNSPENPFSNQRAANAFHYFMNSQHRFGNSVLQDVSLSVAHPVGLT